MEKMKMTSLNKVSENIDKVGLLFPNCVTEVVKGYTVDGKPCDFGDDGAVAVMENVIDFDMLRQELSDVIVEGNKERYQMTWPDKRKAVLLANSPISKTLRPIVSDESIATGSNSNGEPYTSTGSVGKSGEQFGFDSENLYIEGDNLDVLKVLQETYLNQVKMIYIDPPYNTGNDFVYEDNFAMSSEDYMEISNQLDEDGNRLFQNNESNGRFHTDWLNMIYPRLKLAKDLLADDGVIFISIDDNEVDNLMKVCNEIFGESNFISSIPWQSRTSMQNDTDISVNHEYIIAFAKKRRMDNRRLKESNANVWYNKDSFACKPLPLNKEKFSNPDNDVRGLWKADPFDAPNVRLNLTYEIINPNTGEKYMPPKGRCWRTEEKKYNALFNDNRIIFGKTGESRPQLKVFYNEKKEFGSVDNSWFSGDLVGTTTRATKELQKLFKDVPFDTPKPTSLLLKLMKLSNCIDDSIILDFFSGSATTAHAVMQLNAEDGGNRKFICVQLPEVTDEKSEAYKAGYKNICEIGKERIRRAGSKIQAELLEKANAIPKAKGNAKALSNVDNAKQVSMFDNSSSDNSAISDNNADSLSSAKATISLDTGFRVLKLDSTNMKDVYYTTDKYSQGMLDSLESNIKDDRSSLDLLFQSMLEMGRPLSSKIEEKSVSGKKYYTVNDDELVCCFESNLSDDIVTAIAKIKPLYAVFRDSSFDSDSTATNFAQIFATHSPNTKKKVI